MSTLAHEMVLAALVLLAARSRTFTELRHLRGEVASTTGEILFITVLKQVKDPQTRLYLLVEFLETFRGRSSGKRCSASSSRKIHELAGQACR